MSTTHQQIKAVQAELPATVVVTWKDDTTDRVDLSSIIAGSEQLAPLADPEMFARVQVGEWGWEIRWADDLDLSASQLWRWAGEQVGELMPADHFRAWQDRHKLSLTGAAKMLGLSRRMIQYYATGAKPIPKTVRLACIGAEVEMKQGVQAGAGKARRASLRARV